MTAKTKVTEVAAIRQDLLSRIRRELEANRSVLLDVVPTLAARVFVIACGLASSIIMAKVLGPEGRGEYFYIVTLAQLAMQVGNLGLASSNTFIAARDPSAVSKLAANSLWIALALGGVATLVIVFFQVAIDRPDRALYALSLVLLVPSMIYGLLASSILIGVGRAKEYNLFLVANTGLQLAAIVAVAVAAGSVGAMLWVSAGAALAGAALLTRLLLRQTAIDWRFDGTMLTREMGFATRVYLATIAQFAVSRLNVMILDHWSGAGAVGQYSIAVQFFDTLMILPATTAMLLFPELVKADAHNRLGRTMRLAGIIGLLMALFAVAFMAIAPWLIPFMFGEAFAPAVDIARWMMPGLIACSVLNIVSQYLAAERFPMSNLLAWIASLPVLAVAGSILIPQWGGVGAAGALSITYILLAVAIALLAVAKHRTPAPVVT